MRHIDRSRMRLGCILLAGALVFGGCAKKQDSILTPDAPVPAGASISDEARKVTLDTLAVFFKRLPGTDPSADRIAVLKFFRSRPEFEASDMSEDSGNVWARFTDGRLALFVNNRKPSTVITTPRTGGDHGQRQTYQLGKTSDQLPSASTARIINSLGTAFQGSQQTVDSLRRWCTAAGYTLSTPDIATVENLKKMNGDGIFYWSTHGGHGHFRGGQTNHVFCMATSEAVTSETEVKYAAELKQYAVSYMYVATDDFYGLTKDDWRYCVDLLFIRDNIHFADNGLVYFDACGSGAIDPAYAYGLNKAGFYLGWSLPVGDDAAGRAARFFFDKALGMNMLTPAASPPQRPFFLSEVLEEMTKKGLDVDGSAHLVHPLEPVFTNLRLLAPSVSLTSGDMTLSSPTYLIDGDFTEHPGTEGAVLLNEKPQTIVNWGASDISIKKPETGGTLVVKYRNVKSNPVNLTEWHGKLDYTYTGEGTLTQHFVIRLDFWADVHSFYPSMKSAAMYMPLAGMGRTVQWMKSSLCSYDCSGSYVDNNGILRERWTGAGTLPMVDFGVFTPGISGYGMIDSAGTKSPFVLLITGTYNRWTKDLGDTQVPLNFSTVNLEFTHTMPGFVIRAGSATEGDGTIKWQDFSTAYPPDPKAAQ